ncbi:glutathione S-transferase T3-like [Hordeum vulgare]|nr:glutathione S-transferase T3-like [Hordeum vulgare]
MQRDAPAGAQKPRARKNKLDALSIALSRAGNLEHSLPRAADSSARANSLSFFLLRTARAGASAPTTMDAQTGTPLTPLYSREPPPPPAAAATAAAAAENPSAASVGSATAGASPTIGLARSLFLPPRMTTLTGGVAPAPSRAAAAPSKPPMRRVSRDPSIGGDQSRDAYWGRMKEYFDAQNVSGIARSERSLRSRWSTINLDCQKWAAAQKVVDKLNPSGTNEDDRYNIAQNLFKEETRTTKKGKIKKGKIFTLPHCYEVLKDDEKWKKREDLDDLHLSNKSK